MSVNLGTDFLALRENIRDRLATRPEINAHAAENSRKAVNVAQLVSPLDLIAPDDGALTLNRVEYVRGWMNDRHGPGESASEIE